MLPVAQMTCSLFLKVYILYIASHRRTCENLVTVPRDGCRERVTLGHLRFWGPTPAPSPRGGFGGLCTPKQSSKPPNWNVKHYNQWSFCQFLQCQAPPAKTQSPPAEPVSPPIVNFVATVLPHAGVTYLSVCPKRVKTCPSCVQCHLKNLYFVVPTLVLRLR